jgi:hypothetical protein
VCRLLLARICVLENDENEAKRFFQEWKELGSVEHQNIKNLALQIKAEIGSLTKEFHVDSESDDLAYKSLHQGLKSFLLKTAEQKHPEGEEQQAKFLGIARETLRTWKAKLKKS